VVVADCESQVVQCAGADVLRGGKLGNGEFVAVAEFAARWLAVAQFAIHASRDD